MDEEIASDSEDEEWAIKCRFLLASESVSWWPLWCSGAKQAKRENQFGLGELSDEEETAQEKRLRLAKEYLAQLEEEGGGC